MATAAQEREYVAQLSERGLWLVKYQLEKREIPDAFMSVSANWVAEQERELGRHKELSNAEQADLARRASEAAERAAAAAERQAAAAERANRKATAAVRIAIASMIVTIIGIVITHWDAHPWTAKKTESPMIPRNTNAS